MLNIALYKPEIPPNTGNISRLCVGIKAHLHIIGKPAFDMSEKAVRRAGLDHWKKLDLAFHTEWDAFLETVPDKSRIFLITKFGQTTYYANSFVRNDYLVFGNETSGLPQNIHSNVDDSQKLKIPMLNETVRSLNLSNSVAVVAYEAVRQILG